MHANLLHAGRTLHFDEIKMIEFTFLWRFTMNQAFLGRDIFLEFAQPTRFSTTKEAGKVSVWWTPHKCPSDHVEESSKKKYPVHSKTRFGNVDVHIELKMGG